MRHHVKATAGILTAALAATACIAAATPASARPATHPAEATRPAADAGPAYFEMTDPRQTFVVQVTDPVEIQHARDLIAKKTTDMPHVFGRIIKTTAPYNKQWSFHIDPKSLQFFDFSIEVCDSTISYVEDHLDEVGGAFLPGSYWCPWASQLVREVPAPATT